jgi:ribonucleoside-triphosphate reductase
MPGVSEGIHPIFAKYFIRRIRFSKHDPDQVATVEEYRDAGYNVTNCIYAANSWVVEFPTKDSLVGEVVGRYGRDGEEFVQSVDNLTLYDMLEFQALYQTWWADNAVSFTANVKPGQTSPKDVAALLTQFNGQIKGSTIFPETSMPQAPYERLTKEEYERAVVQEVSDGIDEDCSTGACPVR